MGWGWGRFKREGTHVHLWLTYADVWQKATQHCQASILHLGKKEFLEIHRTTRSGFCIPDRFQSRFNYPFSTEEYHLYVVMLTFPTCSIFGGRDNQ